jgi:hypothetical protein
MGPLDCLNQESISEARLRPRDDQSEAENLSYKPQNAITSCRCASTIEVASSSPARCPSTNLSEVSPRVCCNAAAPLLRMAIRVPGAA